MKRLLLGMTGGRQAIGHKYILITYRYEYIYIMSTSWRRGETEMQQIATFDASLIGGERGGDLGLHRNAVALHFAPKGGAVDIEGLSGFFAIPIMFFED